MLAIQGKKAMSMKGESIIPIKISNIIEDNYNLKSFPQIKIKKSAYERKEKKRQEREKKRKRKRITLYR